jgi:hypothetical protein
VEVVVSHMLCQALMKLSVECEILIFTPIRLARKGEIEKQLILLEYSEQDGALTPHESRICWIKLVVLGVGVLRIEHLLQAFRRPQDEVFEGISHRERPDGKRELSRWLDSGGGKATGGEWPVGTPRHRGTGGGPKCTMVCSSTGMSRNSG